MITAIVRNPGTFVVSFKTDGDLRVVDVALPVMYRGNPLDGEALRCLYRMLGNWGRLARIPAIKWARSEFNLSLIEAKTLADYALQFVKEEHALGRRAGFYIDFDGEAVDD